VQEVVAVGVDDPIYVEEACAVGVWRDAPRVEELRRFCRAPLAPWQVPRHIAAWAGHLPASAKHQIDRKAVTPGPRQALADHRPARANRKIDRNAVKAGRRLADADDRLAGG